MRCGESIKLWEYSGGICAFGGHNSGEEGTEINCQFFVCCVYCFALGRQQNTTFVGVWVAALRRHWSILIYVSNDETNKCLRFAIFGISFDCLSMRNDSMATADKEHTLHTYSYRYYSITNNKDYLAVFLRHSLVISESTQAINLYVKMCVAAKK